jgi:hypothetical protein
MELQVGQKVKLDGRTWTVARVGKECRLECRGQAIWRHSRTLERVLSTKNGGRRDAQQ